MTVYLDNAATGLPKSKNVCTALANACEYCGNPGRSGHEYAQKSAEIMWECRKRAAALFGSLPECVVFTSGATASLNYAIKGLCRNEAITSSLEHNAVIRPLNTLRKDRGVVVRQFRVDLHSDGNTLQNFALAAKNCTGMAVVTHASNVCGKLLPIKEMRKNCREELIFVLDAAQTAGHIPIDICELGVDIICIPAHKGLYAPMGVGLLIVNPKRQLELSTIIEGGSGTDSRSLEMPDFLPERLEAGTQNVCGIAALSEALQDFSYPKNEREVFEYLLFRLRGMADITLIGAPEDSTKGFMPVLLFNKRGYDCEQVCEILSQRNVAVRGGLHCAPTAHRCLGSIESGGVRVSIGRHNDFSDIDALADALDF